ncbi:siderophore iron transporter Arn1p [[Candida] anglica]|uniref:Siderophore iron transporter Arn1p n=1 Tax=[Candida] anglica TaxID=148631 RepID=A0ABP0EDY0_9ASCO
MSDSDSIKAKDAESFETEKHDVPIVFKSTSKSIGVRKAEIMMEQYQNPALKVFLFVCIFLVSYVYGIDGTLRYTFQAYATASYGQHSLISTVGVIRAVVAAASQPTYARLSDRFGRIELFVVSIFLYSMGTVIESQAYDVQRFAGGAVLYQFGFSGVMLMMQVMMADFSNLNWRMFCSFVPALPFIINTWVSGDILDSLYPKYSWSFCIGMWAFIFPLSCIPLLGCLFHMRILAARTKEWKVVVEDERKAHPTQWSSWKKNIFVDLFWEIDVVGILFIVCILGFILVPFTLASGVTDKWKQASTIAPLVIGFVFIPPFIVWEKKYARFPITPFALLKDRGVWSALIIGILIDWVWYMPNDFMYTVLMVAMNQSQKATIRITSLYSFVSVIVGPLIGLVIVKFRRTKGFIIFGVTCWAISLGLLVHFRGDNDGIQSEKFVNGVIGSLCLLGFGAGFFTYTTQVSISTCTNHEHMAVVLSLYLSSYNVGLAIGASVSGAVWTNLMYKEIVKQFQKAGIDTALATFAYGSPIGLGGFIETYTWASPERIPVVLAYAHVQKILCIVGLVLVFPLLLATFFLRDHKLESVQSLELAHEGGIKENNGEVVVNDYDDDFVVKKFKSIFGKR